MSAKIKRYETTLATLGLGVIAFGVWNVVKYLIYFILGINDQTAENTGASSIDVTTAYYIIHGIIFALLLIDLALRLIIGLSARSEGLGKKSRKAYIVLSVFIVLLESISVYTDIVSLTESNSEFIDSLTAVLIDITSIAALVWLIVVSIKLKKAKKQIENGGEI